MFDFSDQNTPKNFKKKRPAAGPAGVEDPRLGPYGTMVGQIERHPLKNWQEKRRKIWGLARTAAKLLYPTGTAPARIKGVGTCRWAVQSKTAGVDVVTSTYAGSDDRRASYQGLQTCGLVWVCPACAARISDTRRRQVNDCLAWAKSEGYRIAMMTLTARHGLGDELVHLLDAMKRAKKKLHQHRSWRDVKKQVVAILTATEVTYGRNGWHPHFHVIIIYRDTMEIDDFEKLREPWLASLKAVGLDGAQAAFQVQNASGVGSYISKWGAAEELVLSGEKQAKGGGRTPLQLLQAVQAGSDEAAGAWLEYAAAFKGRTQLDGLKKLLGLAGLDDVSDEEAAADAVQDEQQTEHLMNIDSETWRDRGRFRRTEILEAAETDGVEGVQAILDGVDVEPSDDTYAVIEPIRPGGLRERALAAIPPRELGGSAEIGHGPEPQRSEARTGPHLC